MTSVERYDILRAFGIDVLTTSHIDDNAVMLDDHPVLLVRPGLSPHEHEEILDQLLAELPDCVRASLAV